MDINSPDFFRIIATFTPFLVILGWFLGYLYLRGSQIKFRNLMREYGGVLRLLDNQSREISYDLRVFSPDDPEPYGPLVKDINEKLITFGVDLRGFYVEYSDLQTLFNRVRNPNWRDIKNYPGNWRRLQYRLQKFQQELETAEERFASLREKNNQLTNIGWDIVQQSQQIYEKVKNILADLDFLTEKNLGDQDLDRVVSAIQGWESTFQNQIPVIFLSLNKETIEKQSDRILISKIHRLLITAIPEISRLEKKVSQWKTDFQQINQLLKSVSELNKVISQELDTIEANRDQPVRMDDDKAVASHLFDELNHHQSITLSVSDLHTQLNHLKRLSLQQEQLRRKINKVTQSQNEFILLIKQHDFVRMFEWNRSAFSTFEEGRLYDPNNWKGVVNLQGLHQGLQSLLALQAAVIPRQITGPLLESNLPHVLDSLKKIVEQYERIKQQFDIYFKRFREIQGLEKKAKDILVRDYASLKQVHAIAASNLLFKKRASSEIDRFIQDVEQLNADLNLTAQGVILGKAKKAETLHNKFETRLDKWLHKVIEEVDQEKQALTQTVNILQEHVSMDDPIFLEVIKFIQEHQKMESGIQQKVASLQSVLESVRELRNQSELWQKVMAANKAVEDLAGPVLERFDKMEKSRQNLLLLMKKADEMVPEDLSWPPSTQRLTNERMKYKMLETQYQSFKKQRHKAIQIVALLSDLSDQYKELYSLVNQILDRALQDQKRFTDLEIRLEKSKSLWNQCARNNQSIPLIAEEIAELLSTVGKDYEELVKRYKMGALPYQQAFQVMRAICRKIDEATVQAGSNQIIDINGFKQRQI